jgi:Transposase DDE domain
VKGALAASSRQDSSPPQQSFLEIGPGNDVHEYCVLTTSLVEDLASFGQLYRDRGDAENIFDELKNQWGWGDFTTHDLARCRLTARLVALFYNW